MKKMISHLSLTVCLVFIASLSHAQKETLALVSYPMLSNDLADMAADACINRQKKNNSSKIAIAIYDAAANLMLFKKMDGAVAGASITAMQKAESSARFPFASGEHENWVKNNPGVAHIKGFLGVRGALPIFAEDGTHLGAIGVSGAPSEEDESCAKTAIDAIQKYLK